MTYEGEHFHHESCQTLEEGAQWLWTSILNKYSKQETGKGSEKPHLDQPYARDKTRWPPVVLFELNYSMFLWSPGTQDSVPRQKREALRCPFIIAVATILHHFAYSSIVKIEQLGFIYTYIYILLHTLLFQLIPLVLHICVEPALSLYLMVLIR